MLPEDYWTALKKSKFMPNFWMSPEYAKLAKLEFVREEDLWGWVDPEDDSCWFLPPLGPAGFLLDQNVFAGFSNHPGPNGTFLDREYTYDARRFLNLKGSQWKLYRKNVKKYPRDHDGLVYRRLSPGELEEEIGGLMWMWAQDRELQDPDTFVRYVLYGSKRWGLFRDGVLVGLNVGDTNHSFAIYRYCIDDGTPYLNEYLRHCFYTSPWVQDWKFVNDGGDLGQPGLERFKKRLNPCAVRLVYSYAPPEGGYKCPSR